MGDSLHIVCPQEENRGQKKPGSDFSFCGIDTEILIHTEKTEVCPRFFLTPVFFSRFSAGDRLPILRENVRRLTRFQE